VRGPDASRDAPPPEPPVLEARDFRVLAGLIHEASGVRLGAEKHELLASRLRPLLAQLDVTTYAALSRAVRADATGEKLALLVDRATTNTTGFFRHRFHFDLLRAELPALGHEGKLRIWSAGCSTGEEAYTIALVLLAAGRDVGAKILATDVSQRALAKARAAIYDEEALEPVPASLRLRFEPAPGGRFRVGAEARALVHLRRHDLREAGVHARSVFDAIFCRNVLIYFESAARAAIVSKLARVLRPGGIFFLGPSESGVELPEGFTRIGPAAYKRRGE
jgi:chemotaxis protein methyltransferase CheR